MRKKISTSKSATMASVERLIQSLVTVFETAYQARMKGTTEKGIAIQVDIFAANHKATHPREPKSIELAHRRAASSGMEAADAGVPLYLASTILRQHLNASAGELVRQCHGDN
jgi:hypothetical protein